MQKTVEMAAELDVSIGAHPGFPDIQGFGRRALIMPPHEIYNAVVYQIGALKQFCEIQGVRLTHVKPHGALYNMASVDEDIADAVAKAVYDTIPEAYLFGLYNSELLKAANKIGLKSASEAFADRRYDKDGRLCSRQLPDAVLHTYDEIERQVMDIVLKKRVQTITGEYISIQADTLCFHGDGAGVALYAKSIRQSLESVNVKVRAHGAPL